MAHLEYVRQDLHAQGRVHFADAAADDHCVGPVQGALEEVHSGFLDYAGDGHFLFQLFYFQFHCSDDADFRHISPRFCAALHGDSCRTARQYAILRNSMAMRHNGVLRRVMGCYFVLGCVTDAPFIRS